MTRLKALSPDEVTGKTKEMFTAVNAKFGVVPNMIRTMGQSLGSNLYLSSFFRIASMDKIKPAILHCTLEQEN